MENPNIQKSEADQLITAGILTGQKGEGVSPLRYLLELGLHSTK